MSTSNNSTVVLIGAGHAHLHLVRHADRFIHRGIDLVLVDPGRFWYSGLATGMLGGTYTCASDQIDPARLTQRYGGRFVRDLAVGLDPARRAVRLASGAELRYDAVSFNIGSEVPVGVIPGASEAVQTADCAWTVKPIRNLCRLREQLEDKFSMDGDLIPRVVIIGGGPTGCEVAANIDALARRCGSTARVTLLSRGDRLLRRHPAGASRSLDRALRQRGIERVMSCTVDHVERNAQGGTAIATDGRRFDWDVLVVATGLRPPRMIRSLPLSAGEDGDLRVGATLQSISDERVFGAGDCISLAGHDLPKLGVFGVREARTLLHNLLALLNDEPLKKYRPQKRWLAILHLGGGEGLATWGPLYWRGRLSFQFKDWIDRRFLAKYRPSPPGQERS